MKNILYRAEERGYADHGWLKAYHSFSFANWYDPEKVQFGKLRVLNDDVIAPGKGFGTHPHENMEIVSIPLEGELAHKDNKGHEEIIKHNEIQVMSAGTGIYHSEYNASDKIPTNLLQVWIFPDKNGHTPRYDQKYFDPGLRKNSLHTFISPDKSEGKLWLNQNAFFSWSDLDKDKSITYSINDSNNGLYVFVINGIIKLSDLTLSRRDALGIWNIQSAEIISKERSSILFIEVPM